MAESEGIEPPCGSRRSLRLANEHRCRSVSSPQIFKEQKRRPLPRRILRAVAEVAGWIAIYFFAVAFASRCALKPVAIKDGSKVCTFSIGSRNGDLIVLYERAVIVGEVAGKNEWWLNFPEREPVIDMNGHARAVNYPKSRVLRYGEARTVGAVACHCPETFQ